MTDDRCEFCDTTTREVCRSHLLDAMCCLDCYEERFHDAWDAFEQRLVAEELAEFYREAA